MENKKLLLVFTKNPELGKCKTRLAKTIGDASALKVYKHLLNHTAEITKNLNVDKQVFYSEFLAEEDNFPSSHFSKKLQEGNDLGEKMSNAFSQGFKSGYEQIIIIGSDLLQLNQEDLEKAFTALETKQYVIGPAKDGGYYLLGMTKFTPALFSNKNWSSESVLEDTLQDLKGETLTLLSTKNDIDHFEDIQGIEILEQYL